jgi:hypothetical protein
VVISIKELLDGAGVRYRFNKTNHEFAIANWNGTIWIASGDEPDNMKGPNIGSAGIETEFQILNTPLSEKAVQLEVTENQLFRIVCDGRASVGERRRLW